MLKLLEKEIELEERLKEKDKKITELEFDLFNVLNHSKYAELESPILRFIHDGKIYLKSKKNNRLFNENHEYVGILQDNTIIFACSFSDSESDYEADYESECEYECEYECKSESILLL
jgi:hypothetical protein